MCSTFVERLTDHVFFRQTDQDNSFTEVAVVVVIVSSLFFVFPDDVSFDVM